MSWTRDVLTDYRGAFDTGRWIGIVVIIAMISVQTWDVVVNKHLFNAMGFGVGSGGVLTGLWAYLHGDAKQMETQDKIDPPPRKEGDING